MLAGGRAGRRMIVTLAACWIVADLAFVAGMWWATATREAAEQARAERMWRAVQAQVAAIPRAARATDQAEVLADRIPERWRRLAHAKLN